MARYKKRPIFDDGTPGLFDDPAPLFAEPKVEAPLPGLEQEVKRLRERENYRRRQIFDADDNFSPLEDPPVVDKLNFISFGSGSSGNCAYLGDSSGGILIDAGVDGETVETELARNGIKMSAIGGIILTHDHSDHVRFVYSIVRKHRHIRVYCTPRALNGMLRRHNISNRIKDYHQAIYKEHPFRIGNFTITAFEVQHDGTDNAGFFISHGRHSVAVATDLGTISERADFYLRQANHLMIETNYDSDMLAAGPYPEYLKARIRAERGHLDNEVTAAYLAQIYSPALRNIFLCHLSKDNNKPEIALAAVRKALEGAGVTVVGDCSESPYARMAPVQVLALPRFESTGLITLRLQNPS